MEAVILPSKRSKHIDGLAFKEKYRIWRNSLRSNKLNTPEIFSLQYNSLLSDLKRSIFVQYNTEEELQYLKNNFNVIEND